MGFCKAKILKTWKVFDKMAKVLKSFRIDEKHLEYLQNLKERAEAKSINDTLNLLFFILERDEEFADKMAQTYPLLRVKNQKLTKENTREVKGFYTDDEFKVLQRLSKENGFSSVNKFVRFLVLSHLYDDKILSNDTINEFAQTNNSIKRVGINLNTFLKSIQQNSSVYFDKGAINELVSQIKKQVEETEAFVKEQKKFLLTKLRWADD